MSKVHYHYNIILRPEPEGGFTAIVPALPGCVTHGRNLIEARKMAKDGISAYIELTKAQRTGSHLRLFAELIIIELALNESSWSPVPGQRPDGWYA